MIRKPKGTSNYHFRFMHAGKTYAGTTGTANRTLAIQFEVRKKEEIYKKITLGQGSEPNSIRLSTAIEQYIEDTKHEKTISSYMTYSKKVLGTKKCNRTGKTLKVFALPDCALELLRDRDIQQLITKRRAEGNSVATIIYELVFLSVVFKHCKRLGFAVPVIDFEELKTANKLRAPQGRLYFITKQEENKLLHELAANMPNDSVLAKMQRTEVLHLTVLLLDLGCRLSELTTLKWKDVDMEKKQVSLFRNKVQNESTLMMTNRVFDVLSDRKSVKLDVQEYIFEGRKGGPLTTAYNCFKNACGRAGLPKCSFHTLRHTYASKLVQAGASLYDVQHCLGHSNSSTTERYAHLSPKAASVNTTAILNALEEAAG